MNCINYVGKHLRTGKVTRYSGGNWELVYCTGGKGRITLDEQSIAYGKGEIVAVPPQTNYVNVGDEWFTNVYVAVSDATVPFKRAEKISDGKEKQILRSFNEAYFYFNSDIMNKQLVLSALGQLIVGYLVVYSGESASSEVVREIRDNIKKNYADPSYRLDEHLKSYGYSYDYTRKLFKKQTGVTPKEYLTMVRLDDARLRLSVGRGGISVRKVALSCGFSDPLYFSRMFKKYYGKSPSEYPVQFGGDDYKE